MTTPLRPPIVRQHEDTEIPELSSERCETFLAVSQAARFDPNLMYIRLDSHWHRFYLDAGLLFWREGTAPDEDNDLLAGEAYVDLGRQLHVIGVAVSEITMKNSTLTMRFHNGAVFVLKPMDDGTSVVQLSGPLGE